MRYITKEMLLEAVERKVPLFEDGDEFGDDVAKIIFARQPMRRDCSRVNRKLLVSKIKPKKNWHEDHHVQLTYVTHCGCCGKSMKIPIARSKMTSNHDLFYLTEPYPPYFNMKGMGSVFIDPWIEYKGLINSVVCHSCVEKMKEDYRNFLEWYSTSDKFKFWDDYFSNYKKDDCDLEIKSRIALYNKLVMHSSFDTDGKLEYIECRITYKYILRGGVIMSSKEYHDMKNPQNPNVVVVAKDTKSYLIKKVNTQTNIVSDSLSLTDMFVSKYCRPSDADASMDDFEQISNAVNLNELQLQTNLRAMLYKDFVRTIYWKSIVMRRKWMDNFKCTRCGSSDNLCVHHLTYVHHGDERHHFEDLITVCKDCHAQLHKDAGDI